MNARNLKKMHATDYEQFRKIARGLQTICPAIDEALEARDIDSILSQAEINVLTSALYRLSKFDSFVCRVEASLMKDGTSPYRSIEDQ